MLRRLDSGCRWYEEAEGISQHTLQRDQYSARIGMLGAEGIRSHLGSRAYVGGYCCHVSPHITSLNSSALGFVRFAAFEYSKCDACQFVHGRAGRLPSAQGAAIALVPGRAPALGADPDVRVVFHRAYRAHVQNSAQARVALFAQARRAASAAGLAALRRDPYICGELFGVVKVPHIDLGGQRPRRDLAETGDGAQQRHRGLQLPAVGDGGAQIAFNGGDAVVERGDGGVQVLADRINGAGLELPGEIGAGFDVQGTGAQGLVKALAGRRARLPGPRGHALGVLGDGRGIGAVGLVAAHGAVHKSLDTRRVLNADAVAPGVQGQGRGHAVLAGGLHAYLDFGGGTQGFDAPAQPGDAGGGVGVGARLVGLSGAAHRDYQFGLGHVHPDVYRGFGGLGVRVKISHGLPPVGS